MAMSPEVYHFHLSCCLAEALILMNQSQILAAIDETLGDGQSQFLSTSDH
jgi:hypothetical protein